MNASGPDAMARGGQVGSHRRRPSLLEHIFRELTDRQLGPDLEISSLGDLQSR
jgi:hypothetical protein